MQIMLKQKQKELDLARKTYKLAQGQMMSAEVLYGKDSKGYADAQKLKGEAALKIDALKSQLLVDSYTEEDRLRKEAIAKDEKNAQKSEQLQAKTKAERDKEAADKLKTLEEITKNERAAALSLLDDREQEKRKIVNEYNDKIKLAAANGAETVILEEAKLKALRELNDKFRKEDDDKKKEHAAKEREAEFSRLSTLITDLEYENGLLDDDFQEDLQRLANKEAYLAEQKALELSNLDLTEKERIEIIQKYAGLERQLDKDITDTKKAEMQARMAMQLQYANYVQQIGGIIGQIAGENKDLAIAGIIIEQGAALGKVLIGTASGIAGAVYNGSINPLNATPGGSLLVAANVARQITQLKITGALSAASIIAGAANSISQINKAKTPGGGGNVGGASASAPSYSGGAPSMANPQVQVGQGIDATTQIAQTIGNVQKPIEAYVS